MKNINSHEIIENKNIISINYNKKFFKTNKLKLFFYFSLYLLISSFILTKIINNEMNIWIGIQIFLSFLSSIYFLIKAAKESDVEKITQAKKENYILDNNYLKVIDNNIKEDQISLKNATVNYINKKITINLVNKKIIIYNHNEDLINLIKNKIN